LKVTETNPRQRILGGKYLLREPLGRGGMGSVWVAEHLALHSLVAVKLIEPRVASNPETTARFIREARAAAALRSPHVVQILDHGIDEGTPFIVMELLEGESLAKRLERKKRLSADETARILTQVARAVARAHDTGVVHRDLKPDNIFLVDNDDDELAKVLDFGVAKAPPAAFETSGVGTQEGAFVGTPSYMSPEQAEGTPDIDWRSDLWSLGVIAFECLIGQRPFEAEGLGGVVLKICSRPLPVPSQIAPVPMGFDAWFARACARNPDERFTDAKELAAELRTVCEDPRLVRSEAPRSEPPPARSVAPAPKIDVATQPFWEKEPKAPEPITPPIPSARRSRRFALPLLFALGALFGVAVVLGRATKPSAHIETSVVAATVPSPAQVDPPPAAPAPTTPPPVASAEPAKPAPVSTGAVTERPPTRRNSAPPRAPKRTAPSPPASPAPAPVTEQPSPPPRPSSDRVNLGI
jgi:serine/threonine-protein kinase